VPYKRYVQDALVQRAADYLGHDERSYRHAAGDGRLPIGYSSPACSVSPIRGSDTTQPLASGAIDERRLSHATIWRWVGWLGGMRAALRTTLEMIREKEPSSTVHRQVCAVAAHKYRTPARRTLLEQALRWLLAAAIFCRLFARELFPRFATADDGG